MNPAMQLGEQFNSYKRVCIGSGCMYIYSTLKRII